MSKRSRDKGKRGEREVAGIIRELTGWDAQRVVRQHDDDSDVMGVPGWCIEVKRHARVGRSNLRSWWQQAVRQAVAHETPVLFFRRDRDEWRAVWPMLPQSACLGSCGYEYTVETSIEAWCCYAREEANGE